ncbi:MAG TPA: hypothetical protein DDW65_11225 [Firmicutes bacterium]|jgi:energy-coupling factor transport system substrate-specific component|nr:hypothetical protein [Bacillota bacterium]
MECGLGNVVGARIGLYPMQDNFIEVILGAVKAADKTGLAVITDDLGTTIQGNRDQVFSFVKEVFLRAAATSGHIVANVLFSVGCPGDVPENVDFNATAPKTELSNTDIPIACAWSLYPLGDENYFQVISGEISKAIASADVEVEGYHYCTRLDGTATAVFDLLEKAFAGVSQKIRHTIIHATFSKGSPSKAKMKIDFAKEVK